MAFHHQSKYLWWDYCSDIIVHSLIPNYCIQVTPTFLLGIGVEHGLENPNELHIVMSHKKGTLVDVRRIRK